MPDMRQDEDYEVIHDPEERIDDPYEFRPELQFSKQERRWIIFGALKTTLLIALVYLAGIGLIIWLLLKLWM